MHAHWLVHLSEFPFIFCLIKKKKKKKDLSAIKKGNSSGWSDSQNSVLILGSHADHEV